MNKNIIIITGHGHYATGIKSFIKEVAGDIPNVEFVDFHSDVSVDGLKETFDRKVKESKNSNILFIADIIGGTPFNKAVEISAENPCISVVAGCNPGSILEACLIKDETGLEELCESAVENTKNNVVKFEIEVLENVENVESFEEGI